MADSVDNIALATTSSRHLTDGQKVKLQKATREFEALFVQMVLKSMRGAQGEEGNEFGGESYGGDVMKGMFDTELSKHIGNQGKLGIADSLYRKLTGEHLPGPAHSSSVADFVSSNGQGSLQTTGGAAAGTPAEMAARIIQQLGDSADDSSTDTDAEDALRALSGHRTQAQSAHTQHTARRAQHAQPVAAAGPASDAPQTSSAMDAPSFTAVTIQAPEIALPPSPQLDRPAQAALTASAGLTAKPSMRDASATAGASAAVPAAAALDRVKSYEAIIARTADTVGVDANLLKAMIVEESGAKQHARSSKNAKGLMQLIDTTAESMGVKNVWDPHQNIQGGARYLKQQLDKFNGNVSLALASYNAGPGNVERYNGIPPFRETQNYVKRVMKMFTAFQRMEKNGDEVIK